MPEDDTTIRPTIPLENANLLVSVLSKITKNEFEFTENEIQAVEELHINLFAIISRRDLKEKLEEIKNRRKVQDLLNSVKD